MRPHHSRRKQRTRRTVPLRVQCPEPFLQRSAAPLRRIHSDKHARYLMIHKLTSEERSTQLSQLHGWLAVPGRDAIQRQLKFADFNEAFGFMTRVAIKAQEMDHHPE
jgi:hypothetical protein